MKNKSDQPKGKAGKKLPYPRLCEPMLEDVAPIDNLDPKQRRDLARVYERWAKQLDCSADFIEKIEGNPQPVGTVERAAALVRVAAELEMQAWEIRFQLGLAGKPATSGPALSPALTSGN